MMEKKRDPRWIMKEHENVSLLGITKGILFYSMYII